MKIDGILTINDTLQQDVWSGNSLKPEISQKLIDIATRFFEDLDLEGGELEDITFTGSLANYNWTKFSDIDIHLLVDFSKIDDNYDLVREFFNAKTSLWNKTHSIFVKRYDLKLSTSFFVSNEHATIQDSVQHSPGLEIKQFLL